MGRFGKLVCLGTAIAAVVALAGCYGSGEHAATLALSGQMEESKAVARRLLELEPNFHIRPIMGFLSFIVRSWCARLRQG